jgi:signal recognition particle subunit SRP54
MVLNELGGRITSALASMASAMVIDEAALDACLKDICAALLQADVNVRLVSALRQGVKRRVNVEELASGINRRRVIEKAVFDELCAMLDGGVGSMQQQQQDDSDDEDEGGGGGAGGRGGRGHRRNNNSARFSSMMPGRDVSRLGRVSLRRGKPAVVMFVGLQGCGKTTTCTKFAWWHKKKGWRPALVCADTFRAGAFDQLKQNATKAQIPFYGSYAETDPAVIAEQGVEMFRREGRDLIIVDTSGRHKQEAALFEEMRQVADAVRPDLTIFVMDGSIGQAAFDQAKAFRESVDVGAVIVTKLDGHAKGGGALSAVSATKSPVVFLGTGEHMDQLEPFQAERFVGRLLGRGDVSGLVDKLQDAIPENKQTEMVEAISKGAVSMRVMREIFGSVLQMGPISQIMGMLPGLGSFAQQLGGQGGDRNSQLVLKRYLTIMESMTVSGVVGGGVGGGGGGGGEALQCLSTSLRAAARRRLPAFAGLARASLSARAQRLLSLSRRLPLSLTRTHTHTHTLSLSLSLPQKTPPSQQNQPNPPKKTNLPRKNAATPPQTPPKNPTTTATTPPPPSPKINHNNSATSSSASTPRSCPSPRASSGGPQAQAAPPKKCCSCWTPGAPTASTPRPPCAPRGCPSPARCLAAGALEAEEG